LYRLSIDLDALNPNVSTTLSDYVSLGFCNEQAWQSRTRPQTEPWWVVVARLLPGLVVRRQATKKILGLYLKISVVVLLPHRISIYSTFVIGFWERWADEIAIHRSFVPHVLFHPTSSPGAAVVGKPPLLTLTKQSAGQPAAFVPLGP